jgi:hypothetical protein
LLDGDAAAFVVVRDLASLESCRKTNAPSLHELARWPATGKPFVRIVSNHPRLEWTPSMAACWGPWRIQTERARIVRASDAEVVVESSADGKGAIQVTNESDAPQPVRARFIGGGTEVVESAVLAPGQALRVPRE